MIARALLRGSREAWVALVLLGILVWAPVHSIEEAAWSEHLDLLVPLALFSVGVGVAAAASGLRAWIAHLAGGLLGLEAIVLVFANRMSAASWEGRLAELLGHVTVWLGALIGGGNSRDNVMFALTMAALAWALGWVSAWLVFGRGLGWAALVLNGTLLLLHLSYSYASLNYHFFVQLFAGLLLLVVLELARRRASWRGAGLPVGGRVVRNVVLTSTLAILLIMVLAARGPAEQPTELLEPAWARVSDGWQRGQGHMDRLFGGVQGPPVVVVGLAFGGTMQPREGFEVGTAPILKIASPRSRYWRTTTYEQYTGQGIVSGEVSVDRFEADQPLPIPFGATEAREEVEQTVTILAPQSSLLFAADAPLRVSIPTLLEWRGSQDDPAALRLTTVLRRGQQYTVVSASSIATDAQLRSAGTVYAAGVERYLQLPPTLPNRVRQAAAEVAAGAGTPYDQAVAIERFLREFPYETRVPPPPADRDWVDYTLFDLQSGYTDYYATTMMVMLRTLGVPARVVSGFAPGAYDEEEGVFVVSEGDAHSWVEVFFPTYGWVTFEPSSLRAIPLRPSDEEIVVQIDGEGFAGGPIDEDPSMYFEEPFGFDGDYVPSLPARRDDAWVAALVGLAGVLILAGIAYLALLAVFRRGLAGLPWHAQWYAQFRRLAAWGGLGGRPSQTPDEYVRWLDGRFPGTGSLVKPIADCYVEGAYGGRQPGPETLARAATAWEQARRPLVRRVILRGVVAVRNRLQALQARPRRGRVLDS